MFSGEIAIKAIPVELQDAGQAWQMNTQMLFIEWSGLSTMSLLPIFEV
jgi:hypothetical protein